MTSVGAQFPAGPPQGKLAPSGGSAVHAVTSVGAQLPVGAIIFDMDGTMIDSMPWHARSWIVFMQRHGITMDLAEVLRRTNGLNGAECIRVLFQREMGDAQAWALIHEKEVIYRELFAPRFTEVEGFQAFYAQALAHGLKVGVGTAGDQANIGFVLSHLRLPTAPLAVVGGDEGLPGKPEPAIFLEVARRMKIRPEACIVFEDAPFGIEAARRSGMRAVALCTSHTAAQLDGPHVIAQVGNYTELFDMNFLETLHVATA